MGATFAFSVGQRKHAVAGATALDPTPDMEINVTAGIAKEDVIAMLAEATQQIIEADDDYDL